MPEVERSIPFHVAFMLIFDQSPSDGLLTVHELNHSLTSLQATSLRELARLNSMGLYSFNSSASTRQSVLESEAANQDTLHGIDVDGDGQVSAEEFSLAGRQILRRMLYVYDGNKDGVLERGEGEIALRAIGLTEADTVRALALLDFSRDGMISQDEWQRAGQIDLRASQRDR